jgi:hypothetical protein
LLAHEGSLAGFVDLKFDNARCPKHVLSDLGPERLLASPCARLFPADESRFCLDFHDGRRRVWRQKKERFKNCCVAEHDRFGGGFVMVWGGISYDGQDVPSMFYQI